MQKKFLDPLQENRIHRQPLPVSVLCVHDPERAVREDAAGMNWSYHTTFVLEHAKQIKSEAEANHILRKALKKLAGEQQRNRSSKRTYSTRFEGLLAIKPGAWYGYRYLPVKQCRVDREHTGNGETFKEFSSEPFYRVTYVTQLVVYAPNK